MPDHESKQVIIEANGVSSLAWRGDVLVDWVSGGAEYALDGSKWDRPVNYPYRFDSAVVSPSGRFSVLYEKLGTKGLVLDAGQIIQEINRSYYQANVFEYPVTLFTLPDGREVIAHCPENYCQIQLEELPSFRRLTNRKCPEPADFFHSRLVANDAGTKLLSTGWVWHPFDTLSLYDVQQALDEPITLDKSALVSSSVEINSAAFLSPTQLVCASEATAEDFGDDDNPLKPGTISVYDIEQRRFTLIASLQEMAGTLMPAGAEHVVSFYEHPKLIEVATGRILQRWEAINTGKQTSAIIHHLPPAPPIGMDPPRRRFAVADEKAITVVQLGK